MPTQIVVECLDCGHRAPYSPTAISCPRCQKTWREARYDFPSLSRSLPKKIKARAFNLWRYRELLPVRQPKWNLSLGEGGTPLIKAVNLGMMLGCPHIYIKDERQGPTASFKDRQAAVTIAALKEAGITEAVIASTGNVAIAYSAHAARAGIKLWAFLTSLVPAEKMREVAIYGTQVVKVTASYDQTKHVAAEFARQRGLYIDRGSRSISSVESMKTIAFEIAEQIALLEGVSGSETNGRSQEVAWQSPDWYIQAVSGGLGPLGVLKGFTELQEMGFTDQIPALGMIQTEGCAPMVQAWRDGADTADQILSPRTHIATLSTGDPGRTYTLLKQRMVGGHIDSVTDAEAFRAIHIVAKMEGLSIEPAAGVAFAGLIKMVRTGQIKPADVVVVNCSGHTLPIEPVILGKGWARNVVLSSQAMIDTPEEGLLAALNRVAEDRFPKILVVDDHADARRLIRRILQAQGNFAISEAENGLDALKMARSDIPDLMILDLMMPEVDGFRVLDELKSRQETASIPVIVVTAKTLSGEERQRLDGQIQKLMQKGDFLNDELFKEIKSLGAGEKTIE